MQGSRDGNKQRLTRPGITDRNMERKHRKRKKKTYEREEEKERKKNDRLRKQARRRRLCLCPAWQSCELCDLLAPLQSGATLSTTADWEGAGCLWLDPRSSSPLSHSQSAALTAAQSHAVTVLQPGRGEQGQQTLLAPPEMEGSINLPVSQARCWAKELLSVSAARVQRRSGGNEGAVTIPEIRLFSKIGVIYKKTFLPIVTETATARRSVCILEQGWQMQMLLFSTSFPTKVSSA